MLLTLFGVLILKQALKLPSWELTFLFTCDEEIGSPSGNWVYAQGADYALVFEEPRQAGNLTPSITSCKSVILGSIEVTGRETHAGKNDLSGRSAVLELAHQIIQFYSFNDDARGICFNVVLISGGRPNGVGAGSARGEFCCAGILNGFWKSWTLWHSRSPWRTALCALTLGLLPT